VPGADAFGGRYRREQLFSQPRQVLPQRGMTFADWSAPAAAGSHARAVPAGSIMPRLSPSFSPRKARICRQIRPGSDSRPLGQRWARLPDRGSRVTRSPSGQWRAAASREARRRYTFSYLGVVPLSRFAPLTVLPGRVRWLLAGEDRRAVPAEAAASDRVALQYTVTP
jgi:hypothetical protein